MNVVNYKYWRNKVTELMKNAKEQYYKTTIEENKNSKDIWKHIKELGPKSDHATPNMLNVNGQIANENIDIAYIFNDYFINLSTVLSSNNNMNTGYTETIAALREFTQAKLEPKTEFRIRQIDESEVFTMLNRLNIQICWG